MQQLSINRKPKLAQAEYGDSSKIKSNFLRAMIMLPKPSLSYGNSTCPKTPQRRTFLEEAEAGPAESGVFCRSGIIPLYPLIIWEISSGYRAVSIHCIGNNNSILYSSIIKVPISPYGKRHFCYLHIISVMLLEVGTLHIYVVCYL